MNNFPKRRKRKDNPYTLDYDQNLNTYKVIFFNEYGEKQEVVIDYILYLTFNEFELKDVSEMNEYDRHIEHIELSEESLYVNSYNKKDNLEDEVISNIFYEEIKLEINKLPEIQKRRIKMYFFEDKNLKQISKIENCSIRAVKYSIDIALKKLGEKFKKF